MTSIFGWTKRARILIVLVMVFIGMGPMKGLSVLAKTVDPSILQKLASENTATRLEGLADLSRDDAINSKQRFKALLISADKETNHKSKSMIATNEAMAKVAAHVIEDMLQSLAAASPMQKVAVNYGLVHATEARVAVREIYRIYDEAAPEEKLILRTAMVSLTKKMSPEKIIEGYKKGPSELRRIHLLSLGRAGVRSLPRAGMVIKLLDSASEKETKLILVALREMSSAVIPHLLQGCGNKSEKIRQGCVQVLKDWYWRWKGEVKSDLGPVAQLLADPVLQIRSLAAETLVMNEKHAVAAIRPVLTGRSFLGRKESLKVLGRFGKRADKFLKELTRFVENGSLEEKVLALNCLESIGKNAKDLLPVVRNQLDAKDFLIVSAALRALGEIGGTQAKDGAKLKALSHSLNAGVRAAALTALSTSGAEDDLVALSLGALGDPAPEVRETAVNLLSKKKSRRQRTRKRVLELMKDPSDSVRLAIVKDWGRKVNDFNGAEMLLLGLRDENIEIRRWAVWHISNKNLGRQVAKPLIASLKDTDDTVRVLSALALGTLKSQGAEISDALLISLRDKNLTVRWNSVLSLRYFSSRTVADALVRALGDSKIERAAVGALEVFGTRAEPSLLQGLKSEDALVRRGAAEVLGLWPSRSMAAVRALNQGLKDPDPEARAEAIWALGQIGSRAEMAVPQLIDFLLNHKVRIVSRRGLQKGAAATALRKIGNLSPEIILKLLDWNKGSVSFAVDYIVDNKIIDSDVLEFLIDVIVYGGANAKLSAWDALLRAGPEAEKLVRRRLANSKGAHRKKLDSFLEEKSSRLASGLGSWAAK